MIRKILKKVPYAKKVQKYFLNRRTDYALRLSEYIGISFPKSGRTWIKVLLAKAFSKKYGVEMDARFLYKMSKSDNHIPPIHFTHIGALNIRDIITFAKKFHSKKILFVVRDPRDTIVSYFYQLKNREKLFRGSISDFIHHEKYGIRTLINFLNTWYQNKDRFKDFLIVRYEDLHKNPDNELDRILEFIGVSADNKIIRIAVEFAKFENMQRMEQKNKFNWAAMKPVDTKDANSYKVRKGKIGSFRDELSKADIKYIDIELKNLDSGFMYNQDSNS